ncbi:uncharacterized protein TNCV_4243131 [Trichonephila clavipes]|nr:uncharacterized protein TNCV_4243131 [Trichonephila clavipes]
MNTIQKVSTVTQLDFLEKLETTEKSEKFYYMSVIFEIPSPLKAIKEALDNYHDVAIESQWHSTVLRLTVLQTNPRINSQLTQDKIAFINRVVATQRTCPLQRIPAPVNIFGNEKAKSLAREVKTIDICQLPPEESGCLIDEENIDEDALQSVLPADVCGKIEISTNMDNDEISHEDMFDPEEPSTTTFTHRFYV